MDTFDILRQHLDSAFDTAAGAYAASSATAATAATPCTEFTVAQLRAHLLGVGLRIAAMGRGEPDLSVPNTVEAADGDYQSAFAAARASARESWSALEATTGMVAPWRELSAADAAGIYAAELIVHAWDLATASGTTIEVNDAVIATSQEALEREVPVEGRAELWARSRADLPEDFPWSDPFGAVPPLSGEISALDRLVATSGRDPRWTADQPSASATA